MKVTLVRAPLTLSKFASASPAVPPIGMAYIAASLQKAGHQVAVIDNIGEAIDKYVPFRKNTLYRGLSIAEIVEKCGDTDVIGLSIMFSQDWPISKEVIESLKRRNPRAIIVAGGEHVTAEPVGALEDCPELDYVVLGEGDFVLPELLDTIASGGDVSALGSVCFRGADGKIVSNPKRARNRNIDEFPWPAWELFPLEPYLAEGHGWGVNRGRSMPIVASRGCPYQCTFCSNPTMWTTRWVARATDDVIKEIEFYMETYGATNFDFQDLTAIVKKDWIKEFCLKLIDRKLNITWQLPTGTRSEAIDAEVAALLFQSGCKNITYAPESGSVEVLKRIKKKIRKEHIYDSARACLAAGLDVKFNFIFGFPEDKYKNMFESIGWMVKLAYIGVSDISIAPFSPYPGSELFRQIQAKGKIPAKLDEDYYIKIPFSDMSATESWCDAVPSRQLNRMRNLAMLTFYLVSWTFHPTRPFKRLYNFVMGIEESRMDKALGDMRRRVRLLKTRKGGPQPSAVRPF